MTTTKTAATTTAREEEVKAVVRVAPARCHRVTDVSGDGAEIDEGDEVKEWD